MQQLTAALSLILLTSCVHGSASGISGASTQEVLQSANEGAAIVSGAELVALLLMGRSPDAVRCVQYAFGPTAQMELAIAPQGLPKQDLWVLDFADVLVCTSAAILK